MKRYRIQIWRPEIHSIDADTPELATEQAIVRVQTRVAPDHYFAPVVGRIEVVAEVLDGVAR